MSAPVKSILVLIAILSLAIPQAYAISTNIAAGSSGSGVSITTVQSGSNSAAIEDSAVLSFNGGVGVYNQVKQTSPAITGSGDLNVSYTASLPDGSKATVSTNVTGSQSYLYSYTITPNPSGAAKAATASQTLSVINSSGIIANATSSNTEGDCAFQGIVLKSNESTATISNYVNSASADKTSASATQSFSSLSGAEVNTTIFGYAKAVGASGVAVCIAKNKLNGYDMSGSDGSTVPYDDDRAGGSGQGYSNLSIINYKATSTIKSRSTITVTETADQISGRGISHDNSVSNAEGDKATTSGTINGGVRHDDKGNITARYLATVSKYSEKMSADAKSATVSRGFASITGNVIDLKEEASTVVNNVGDKSTHTFSVSGNYWISKNTVFTPLSITGYGTDAASVFKASKSSGTSGGMSISSITDLNANGYISSDIRSTHYFNVSMNDYSSGSFSISGNPQLQQSSKTAPAFKATTSASSKKTSTSQTTIRGKGNSFSVNARASSSAVSSAQNSDSYVNNQNGAELSTAATTTSSGKVGDKKGASVSATSKVVKYY